MRIDIVRRSLFAIVLGILAVGSNVKTPIIRPAVEAIVFGFERIGMVVRIAWLPIIIVLVLYAAAFMALAAAADITLTGDVESQIEDLIANPAALAVYRLFTTILPISSMLILSCVYVALTRAATHAAYEPPNLPFYFAFGSREFRYFLTRILYTLLIIAATLVLLLVGAALGAGAYALYSTADEMMRAAIIGCGVSASVWLLLIWLWVIVRFLPVLPIAAVENRIAFGDAWKMTKGAFWRISLSGAFFVAMLQGVAFVLMIALILPVAIIGGVMLAVGASTSFGPALIAAVAVSVLILVPGFIAMAALIMAAQAAFPARLYAYLTGCGEDCKI